MVKINNNNFYCGEWGLLQASRLAEETVCHLFVPSYVHLVYVICCQDNWTLRLVSWRTLSSIKIFSKCNFQWSVLKFEPSPTLRMGADLSSLSCVITILVVWAGDCVITNTWEFSHFSVDCSFTVWGWGMHERRGRVMIDSVGFHFILVESLTAYITGLSKFSS